MSFDEEFARTLRPVAPPRILEGVYADDQCERMLDVIRRECPWPTNSVVHVDSIR
jgi:hypothetical protein